ARIRRKEALWKEYVLQREVDYAEVRARTSAIRGYLESGHWTEAEVALGSLRAGRGEGDSLPERIRQELETMEKAISLGKASDRASALLTQAESEYSAGRYSDVEPILGKVAESLVHLPRKRAPDLHDRYKKLSKLFETQNRSFVELFAALRVFVENIGQEYHRLHELYGAGRTIEGARIKDVLRKIDAARKNLGTIDRVKVGRAAYESTQRQLDEQEIVLRDLGTRLPKVAPPEG
ncbi:MAG TPA: hypothetical protein VKU80_04525, partial [Planctomycetota bacterium]|nr:hypothetical protein [Planctomycetota bacterium]